MTNQFFLLLSIVSLSIGYVALTKLAIIDLRTRLLPNPWVATFGLCGILFHFGQDFTYLTPLDLTLGCSIALGVLLTIRALGNAYYKKDTLGLGDVKLIAAGGLWLGINYIMLALSAGAFLCILHGIIVSVATKQPLSKLYIPAGPGLCAGLGIVIATMLFTG
jgi:prepilin signal peptidase PulO-like enzyme (type II secretory pathway)